MKKICKLASLFLVLAMSLALAIPCFAASPKQDEPFILDIGESYTDPVTGITYSLEPWSGFSEDEKAAIESGNSLPIPLVTYHYYSRGVEVRTGSKYTVYFNAQAQYGNVFAAKIDTSNTANLSGEDYTYVTLKAPEMNRSGYGRVPKGQSAVFKMSGGTLAFTGEVEMTLEREPEIWAIYDVYQYED